MNIGFPYRTSSFHSFVLTQSVQQKRSKSTIQLNVEGRRLTLVTCIKLMSTYEFLFHRTDTSLKHSGQASFITLSLTESLLTAIKLGKQHLSEVIFLFCMLIPPVSTV